MDGSHSIERCEEVTGAVLQAVFSALHDQRVWLERMLLKPNMVIAGKDWPSSGISSGSRCSYTALLASPRPCGSAGHRVLVGRPGGSGGTVHLDAINRLPGTKPWKISFSYGRALQDHAMETWHGRDENLAAGRQALYQRARCNSAASLGSYTDEMEDTRRSASPVRRIAANGTTTDET